MPQPLADALNELVKFSPQAVVIFLTLIIANYFNSRSIKRIEKMQDKSMDKIKEAFAKSLELQQEFVKSMVGKFENK